MSLKFLILIALLLSSTTIFSACSTSRAESKDEVVFDDGYKVTADNEVVIDENALAKVKLQNPNFDKDAAGETTQVYADQSKVVTLLDGFGNKTETRYFKGHARLRFVVVQTNARGEQEITAYGYNGDIKPLPAEMSGQVLSASAEELANAAGLTQMRRTHEIIVKKENQLQPQPSYKFPIQNQPPQQTVIDNGSTSTEQTEETTSPTTKPQQQQQDVQPYVDKDKETSVRFDQLNTPQKYRRNGDD